MCAHIVQDIRLINPLFGSKAVVYPWDHMSDVEIHITLPKMIRTEQCVSCSQGNIDILGAELQIILEVYQFYSTVKSKKSKTYVIWM